MASHTATGEWKSFEIRMRHRRAERVLAKASAAADAGRIDEARGGLEEARSLAPNLPGISALERRLELPELAPASGMPATRWGFVLAAIVAVAAGSFFAMRSPEQAPAIAPTHDFRLLALAVADPIPSPTPAAQPGDIQPEIQSVSMPASEIAEPDGMTRDTEAPPAPPLRMDAAMPIVTTPPVPELVPIPAAVTPASLRVEDGVPVGTAGTAVSVPVNTLPPASAAENGDAAVRRTLDKYAQAYSALDATAAAQVWPSVNRSALTRAFGALESQEVSLGTCHVDVRGAVAHAACAGSTTWRPKVGGDQARTEPRLWSFELARRGTDWQIVSARVQNR